MSQTNVWVRVSPLAGINVGGKATDPGVARRGPPPVPAATVAQSNNVAGRVV